MEMVPDSHRGARPGSPPEGSRRPDPALDSLRRRLVEAGPDLLERAACDPRLTEREMLLIARNRRTPPARLGALARDRRWTRFHEIKRALALNPGTPAAAARNLLPHLYWKDLAELARAPHVPPIVRRQAERRLRERVPDLSLGEKIALSRVATRPVLELLRDAAEAPVLEAVACNPRALEADAVRIAGSHRSPPVALERLARDARWGGRRAVRLELIGNPRTPVPVALRLLRGLHPRDVQRVVADVTTPRIVRVSGERLLRRTARPSASSPGRA